MGAYSVQPAAQSYYGSHYTKYTITFDGSAGKGMVGTPVGVFIMSGVLIVRNIFFQVGVMTGGAGATLAAGFTGNTTIFNAATLVSAMDGSTGVYWTGGTIAKAGLAPAAQKDCVVTGDVNIIITPAVTDTTAGVISAYAFWDPVSAGAQLAPAG